LNDTILITVFKKLVILVHEVNEKSQKCIFWTKTTSARTFNQTFASLKAGFKVIVKNVNVNEIITFYNYVVFYLFKRFI
jgi:hypothetical protein